ncbi:hypothetical protein pb186bvf_009210 [Paramecium bursaria]
MLMEFKCQEYTHNKQQIIGLCQNPKCKQQSRRACLKCLQQLHNQDEDFKIQDILSEEDIKLMISEYKENIQKRNQSIQKQSQINQYLLIQEILEFMKYWQQKFQQQSYVEDILQLITEKSNSINFEKYINDNDQQVLKQILDNLNKKSYNDINQILSGNFVYFIQQKSIYKYGIQQKHK